MKPFRWFRDTFFAPHMDLHARLFHLLALSGSFISLSMGLLGIVINNGIVNVAIRLAISALALALLTYSRLSGRYGAAYTISIIVAFIAAYPVLFFTAGGYLSGMPSFFILAVAFTVFMLEGRKAVICSAAELALYIAICLIAYYRPRTVNPIIGEREALIDTISGFTSVSAVLGICMLLYFRLYKGQQKKLDEQNIVLAQTSRAKTEFLANASHEMRTPLTIISVNVQTALEMLEDSGLAEAEPEAARLLVTAQSEIMRLARMVSGMLTLASLSEGRDKAMVDFTALLASNAEMLRLGLALRGNTLTCDIEPRLRVFGSADLLAQVVTNLIQNAERHTTGGAVTLTAAVHGGTVTVTVSDTGSGISADLLPRLFERGGTGGGGTGFGLHLCKTIIESHGGRIWIENGNDEQLNEGDADISRDDAEGNGGVGEGNAGANRGAAVRFSLPLYEGQFGDAKE